MTSNEEICLSAQELVDRHGERAAKVAMERVELLKSAGNSPDLDMALRVLSEVEKLIGLH